MNSHQKHAHTKNHSTHPTSEGAVLRKFKYHFFILPALAVALSLGALLLWGLNLGIDLKGGSLLEVSYPNGRPETQLVEDAVAPLNLGEVRIQPSGENNLTLRQRSLSIEEKDTLVGVLREFGEGGFEELQYTSVGPSIGTELIRKAWWAIALVSLCTIVFIAFAFRGVSKPVSSWKYGLVAIVTLVHDVLIPTGYFAFLGHTRDAEVGALFIVALLTILGISINDTIVVFDRIRENLTLNEEKKQHQEFEFVVWKSVRQTMARSINTSVAVVIMLVTMVVLGPESTKDFSLVLTIGMVAGTYSSIFLAAPLLVVISEYWKSPEPIEKKA